MSAAWRGCAMAGPALARLANASSIRLTPMRVTSTCLAAPRSSSNTFPAPVRAPERRNWRNGCSPLRTPARFSRDRPQCANWKSGSAFANVFSAPAVSPPACILKCCRRGRSRSRLRTARTTHRGFGAGDPLVPEPRRLAAWDLPVLAMLMTILNFGYSHRLHARLEKAAGSLERAAQDLQLLAEVLALTEQEDVSSPKLVAIQSALRTDGSAPSQAIGKLARVVDLLESRHSLFARPLDLVTFWSARSWSSSPSTGSGGMARPFADGWTPSACLKRSLRSPRSPTSTACLSRVR